MIDWIRQLDVDELKKKTLKFIVESGQFIVLKFFINPYNLLSFNGLDGVNFKELIIDVTECNDFLRQRDFYCRLDSGYVDELSIAFLVAVNRSEIKLKDIVINLIDCDTWFNENYATAYTCRSLMECLFTNLFEKITESDTRLTSQRYQSPYEEIHMEKSNKRTQSDFLIEWVLRYSPNLRLTFENLRICMNNSIMSIGMVNVTTSKDEPAVLSENIKDSLMTYKADVVDIRIKNKVSNYSVKIETIQVELSLVPDHITEIGYKWHICYSNDEQLKVNLIADAATHNSNDSYRNIWTKLRSLLKKKKHISDLSGELDHRINWRLVTRHMRLWTLIAVEFWVKLYKVTGFYLLNNAGSHPQLRITYNLLNEALNNTSFLMQLILLDKFPNGSDTIDLDVQGSPSAVLLVVQSVPIRLIISIYTQLSMRYFVLDPESIYSSKLNEQKDFGDLSIAELDELLRPIFIMSLFFKRITLKKSITEFKNLILEHFEGLPPLIYSSEEKVIVLKPNDSLETILASSPIEVVSNGFHIAREIICLLIFHHNVADEDVKIYDDDLGTAEIKLNERDWTQADIEYIMNFWEDGSHEDASHAREMARRQRNYLRSMKKNSTHDMIIDDSSKKNFKYRPNEKREKIVRQKQYLKEESNYILNFLNNRFKQNDMTNTFRIIDNWLQCSQPCRHISRTKLAELQSDPLLYSDHLMASFKCGMSTLWLTLIDFSRSITTKEDDIKEKINTPNTTTFPPLIDTFLLINEWDDYVRCFLQWIRLFLSRHFVSFNKGFSFTFGNVRIISGNNLSFNTIDDVSAFTCHDILIIKGGASSKDNIPHMDPYSELLIKGNDEPAIYLSWGADSFQLKIGCITLVKVDVLQQGYHQNIRSQNTSELITTNNSAAYLPYDVVDRIHHIGVGSTGIVPDSFYHQQLINQIINHVHNIVDRSNDKVDFSSKLCEDINELREHSVKAKRQCDIEDPFINLLMNWIQYQHIEISMGSWIMKYYKSRLYGEDEQVVGDIILRSTFSIANDLSLTNIKLAGAVGVWDNLPTKFASKLITEEIKHLLSCLKLLRASDGNTHL